MWSINERLANKPGLDIDPLESDWMWDIVACQKQESDEIEKQKSEQEDKADRIPVTPATSFKSLR